MEGYSRKISPTESPLTERKFRIKALMQVKPKGLINSLAARALSAQLVA